MKLLNSLAVSSVLLSSSLFANTNSCIDVQKGWNLLGSSSAIPVANYFNNSDKIKTVWAYDTTSGWKAYSSDTNTINAINNAGINFMNSIDANKGFWVNSTVSECLPFSEVANSAPSIDDTYLQPSKNNPSVYEVFVAKGVPVNMNLNTYVKDLESDSVNLNIEFPPQIPGLNISNDGNITGNPTDINSSGNLEIELNDGTNSNTVQIKVTVIEDPDELIPNATYGDNVNLTNFDFASAGSLFMIDDEDEYEKIEFTQTSASIQEFERVNGSFVLDDNETITVKDYNATSLVISELEEDGDLEEEKITIKSARYVTQIGNTPVSGLVEAQLEFETLKNEQNISKVDEWWPSYYSDGNNTISTIDELATFLSDNRYAKVYIDDDKDEDDVVYLNSDGTLSQASWDGTYASCNACNNGKDYYINYRMTTTKVPGGTWKKENGYLTVNVPDEGAVVFKETTTGIQQAEIDEVGEKDTEIWYYGISQQQLEGLLSN